MAPILEQDPEADPDAVAAGLNYGRFSGGIPGIAGAVAREDQALTGRLWGWSQSSDAEAFDRRMERMTGYSDHLSPDEATRRFGVPGYLNFTRPVTEVEAAYQQSAAQNRQFRDFIASRSDLGPVSGFFNGLIGGAIDPVGIPLMFMPEALGVGRLAEWGISAGLRGTRFAAAAAATGRIANAARGAGIGALEGAVGGGIYEVANYETRHFEHEDYTFGDAGRNILIGMLSGGVIRGVTGGLARPGGRGEAAAGERPPRDNVVPSAIEALDPEARSGATMTAIEAAIDDAPVRLGPAIDAEHQLQIRVLDEGAGGTTQPIAARLLEADVAVTTRGREVPVRYAIVELDDLTTSHGDDLEPNPDFPGELQPRTRERAGAQARNFALEKELNPKRLMREAGAESGAPIISQDGVVESGNGRTIAIRRSAHNRGPAYERYKAELEAQGFDVSGFENPVLVRMRTEPMTGQERVDLTREMNADVTERLSVTEQAMTDAESLDPAMLAQLSAGQAGGVHVFARAFLARVAPDQINALVGPDGRLSKAGADRINAALAAKAYGDPRLIEAIFETAEPTIKAIGGALVDAAPQWAAMRDAAARGAMPPALDITAHLRGAVDLLRWARERGLSPWQVIQDRLEQEDMFGGRAISPESEGFLRLFYRDEGFRQPRSGAKIGEALNDYARMAQDEQVGPNLFGDTPDAGTAVEILRALGAKYAKEGDKGVDPLGLDVPEPGPKRTQPDPIDLRPQSSGRAGQAGSTIIERPAESGPAAAGGPEGDLTAGPAVWRNKDNDLPVEVVDPTPHRAPDGRAYVQVRGADGQESFLPADEIHQARAEGAPGGAVVFHGTPHEFDAFDVERAGTGEGGQWTAHGLHFTDNPEQARAYAEMAARSQMSPDEASHPRAGVGAGRVVQARIPEPAHLLDWDLPMEGQPPKVQAALKALGGVAGETGERFYRRLAERLGSDKAASEALREAGVLGVRELTGNGAERNFVVFHQDDARIVGPGPAAPRGPPEAAPAARALPPDGAEGAPAARPPAGDGEPAPRAPSPEGAPAEAADVATQMQRAAALDSALLTGLDMDGRELPGGKKGATMRAELTARLTEERARIGRVIAAARKAGGAALDSELRVALTAQRERLLAAARAAYERWRPLQTAFLKGEAKTPDAMFAARAELDGLTRQSDDVDRALDELGPEPPPPPEPDPTGDLFGGMGEAPAKGQGVVARDPELRAIAEQVDREAAENGVELDPVAPGSREDPNVTAEAIRAAAFCLSVEVLK